ncbi:hypothetical protein EBS43_03625 [bacterium]|nr:hypothetical protein [bacterium]
MALSGGMNKYFLVTDSKGRLVFKKKVTQTDPIDRLTREHTRLDFQCFLLEGENFQAAAEKQGFRVLDESAFYSRRELKDEFFFTDKRIKEFLGNPDRIEKSRDRSGSELHLFSKTRVEKVLEDPRFQKHAQSVRAGRQERFEQEEKQKRAKEVSFSFARPRSMREQMSAPKDNGKIKDLARKLRKDWDLTEYKEFFPVAREMKRRHVFFMGPTNSGKSYRGFNYLTEGDSGVYLAPLRLLALEGQEEIEKRGKACSLLTGEEMELKPEARFVASTIEMANLDRPIDGALIDEIQLILDQNRGWAWAQALIGIPARTIIMTGSSECLPTLRRIIEEYLGETLEVVELQRIGELEVLPRPLKKLTDVEPGTAIISFSRRGVLSLKKELEDAGKKVSVLYGNLSPGVRVRLLNIQEIKQIGGRAGRYGQFEKGHVTAAHSAGLKLIQMSMHAQPEAQEQSCYVRPTQSQLELLRQQLGDQSIKNAITLFSQLSNQKSVLVCSDLEEMLGLADRIEASSQLSQLSFTDKYLFVCAPVSTTDVVIESFLSWLVSYSKNSPVNLYSEQYSLFIQTESTSEDRILNSAENSVKILTLYHWLARKKPEHFPSMEICEALRGQINLFIENSLKRRGLHKKCVKCSRKLPLYHNFKICDSCYQRGF